MPRLVKKTPAYRHHKSDGRAVVTINGQDIYLGRYNSPESRAEYDRLIAVWLTSGRCLPATTSEASYALTVNELILSFWLHAEGYYRRADGSPAAELDNLRLALIPLRQLYGTISACDFGPVALKTVRQTMVDAGLGRRTVNQRIARIARTFRFGVENELVPAAVHQALKAVPGLKAGRSGVKEARKVKPVPDDHVEAVRLYLSSQ